jgi:hypothetical protein
MERGRAENEGDDTQESNKPAAEEQRSSNRRHTAEAQSDNEPAEADYDGQGEYAFENSPTANGIRVVDKMYGVEGGAVAAEAPL